MSFPRFGGWPMFTVLAVASAVIALGYPASQGFSVEALRWGLHATARVSALLFLLAFTASAAVTLMPGGFTRWQMRNRRMFGLAFAVSHLIHAGFIVAFSAQGPREYAEAITPDMILVGSIGYALILLMAATSFRTTAGWIGPRNWKLLHTIGIHWLALQFAVAFGKRIATGGALYAVFAAAFVLAFALRLVAARRRAMQRRAGIA